MLLGNRLHHSSPNVGCQHFGMTKGSDVRHKKTVVDSAELGRRLGRAIADRRKALRLTQDDLAGLVEVDAETVSRFERGSEIAP